MDQALTTQRKAAEYSAELTMTPQEARGPVSYPVFSERGQIINPVADNKCYAFYRGHPNESVQSAMLDVGIKLARGFNKTISIKVEVMS